ncbi:MAG TPA: hypothetical protein K8V15_07920, partial [Tessaracoccus flavescens]|nr:hypothetical protein [Tessaracoccus flavescens]
DLTSIAPAAKWAVTESTFGITEHTGRAACLSTDSQEANPTHSMQRLLATSDDDRLAALHRIDVYATPIAATNVMADLTTRLSTCSELPARIVRSSSVTGMADEAFQLTVVFEDATPQYHTVLLTRAGAAVQLIDVVRNGEPVAPDALTQAIARPQAILCTEQEVTCGTPAVADALIPPGQPQGWLIPADLPRITAGAGRWTMSDPAGVTSRGMGCENMNLTSEPGPTARQQATYLITEDPKAPGAFGMDEMIFTFADNAAADAFTDKLTSAIASCKDRVNTASVQELAPVTSTGANDVGISSRIFNVSQATGDKPVPFQLIVSKAGNRVVYTLTTVSADYKFTDAQLAELGIRIPLRASQA